MAGQERLTRLQAQRIALAAQGFTGRKPASRVERRHLLRLLDRIGLFQIDSVNVVQRAQYMPAFSRLGAYDTAILAPTKSYGRTVSTIIYYILRG